MELIFCKYISLILHMTKYVIIEWLRVIINTYHI